MARKLIRTKLQNHRQHISINDTDMKRTQSKSYILIALLLGLSAPVEAQILKGFGKKVEKKIEQRIERKADRQVDKVLDKADRKTDESINEVFSKPNASPTENKSSSTVSAAAHMEAQPELSVTIVGANCHDFSWFKKGSILAYEAIDGKGKNTGQWKMEVKDLRSNGSQTIAQVEATMSSPHFEDIAYPMNYICEGDKIYMDIASMLKAMMEKNPDMKNEAVRHAFNKMEIDFNDGFASFPKTMYPGMLLDDLRFSFKTNVGDSEMSFDAHVTGRQVLAREKVTTKAGTFDCLKIQSHTNVSVNVMGINQRMPTTTEYLWIAAGIGMVKQQTMSDKEDSTMQLTSIKM